MDKAGRWIRKAVVLSVLGFKDCSLVLAQKATRAVTDMKAIIMKAKEVVTVFTCGETEMFTRVNGRKVSSMEKAVSHGPQVLLTLHYYHLKDSVDLPRL